MISHDPADDRFDSVFGLRSGTVRDWRRAGIIPTPATEHAVVAAYLSRPAASGSNRTAREMTPADHAAAQAAAVRYSLDLADPEGPCSTATTTAALSAPAAA